MELESIVASFLEETGVCKGMKTDCAHQVGDSPRRRLAMPLAVPSLRPRAIRLLLAAALLCCAGAGSLGVAANAVSTNSAPETSAIVLPPSVPDPAEPMNRALWELNQGLLTGVVAPTARVYRHIVIRPLRRGIGNFGRNLLFPGRLLNNVLEGKWTGAGDESARFLCNTIVGIGGFVDVGRGWQIPKSDADFGQTFGMWGWRPDFYLMLPLLGPSNDRDAVGLIGDTLDNPLTYFTPYSYISAGIVYNDLTDQADDYVRFVKSEFDGYSLVQYAWTFARKNQVLNFRVTGKQDLPSLETLQSVFFTFENPEFPGRGATRSAFIPGTRKRLDFTFWLQPRRAPVVYIVPGLGSHRLAETSVALAELVYKNGFSAVCLSSPFNFEFMEQASTVALPAYAPIDTRDLHVALTEIDRELTALYPSRLGRKALLGYSMGGFESLFIAATSAATEPLLIHFDRVVTINAPVSLTYGMAKLDEFYQAPLAWPESERTEKIQNTFLKVAALSRTTLRPQGNLPFDAVESKFLIGLAFRFILRDIIYSTQQRDNLGVLEHPLKDSRRGPAYHEIMQYSYQDYYNKFAVPYYRTKGIDLAAPDALEKAGDLRSRADGLRANPSIRLIVNQDDFLMPDPDLAWLRETFKTNQLTVFERGGHLGNLANPAVQRAIVSGLEDLKPLSAPPRVLVPPPKDSTAPVAVPTIP